MGRFIRSRRFRLVSFLTVFAMLVPFYALLFARKAQAQIELREQWAVVDFTVANKSSVEGLGKAAAQSLRDELAKLNRFDVMPGDQVEVQMAQLGYDGAVSRADQLMRLGQALGAATVVNGEIVNQRVREVGNGKLGEVKVRVIVRDVASGLPINGAAVYSASAVRGSDTSDETLLQQAIADAAFKVVSEISSNTLAKGTVLNTTDKNSLVNKGIRSGFKAGQKVIVLRGREQVGTGEVVEVEPDQCYVRLIQSSRGIQPGDKIQVLFELPTIVAEFGKTNDVGVVKSKPKANNNGLITAALVLGLAFLLLAQKGSSNNRVITEVSAEPILEADDRIGVLVSWRPDGFVKGRANRVQWQVWRSDVPDAPVFVGTDAALGGRPEFRDYGLNGTFNYYQQPTGIDPICPGIPGTASGTGSVIESGVPYTYSVELLYRVSALDNPNAGSSSGSGGTSGSTAGGTSGSTAGSTAGGTSGSTAGSTTGGLSGGRGRFDNTGRDLGDYYQATTTGGTTGGNTTGGSASDCYYLSDRVSSKGTATPYRRPLPSSPQNNVTVTTPQVFRFDISRPQGSGNLVEYIIQFSTDFGFAKGKTSETAVFVDNSASSTISTPVAISNVTTIFPGATEIWWRVGVRAAGDVPGPASANGQRFIFSAPFKFKRATNPPNP